jgi:hypothetical protein
MDILSMQRMGGFVVKVMVTVTRLSEQWVIATGLDRIIPRPSHKYSMCYVHKTRVYNLQIPHICQSSSSTYVQIRLKKRPK